LIWALIKKFKIDKNDLEKPMLLWTIGISNIIFFSIYIYLNFFFVDETNARLTNFLASSRVAKIEGRITDLTRFIETKKYGTITFESFKIDSVKFSYNDYLLEKFNKFGKTDNGMFKNGLQLKVTYLKADSSIQKVEIVN